MSDTLPKPQATLLLATRCFGRATPFPHVLMRRVLAALDESPYDTVTQSLQQHQMIEEAGKKAFDLTNKGLDWRKYEQTPSPIWDAAIDAITEAAAVSMAADDREILDLLYIHAAGLANTFYTRYPHLYLRVLGVSVLCLQHLGRGEDADVYIHSMQEVMDRLNTSNDKLP